MPGAHPLEDVFAHADYRVRLARGGFATIRVGQPLPTALAGLLPAPGAGWGFITAWNPRGEARDRAANRLTQRALRDALRKEVPAASLRVGLGTLGEWREPSLFVAGIGLPSLDDLMLRFDQLAVVHGTGSMPAGLRWNSAASSGPT